MHNNSTIENASIRCSMPHWSAIQGSGKGITYFCMYGRQHILGAKLFRQQSRTAGQFLFDSYIGHSCKQWLAQEALSRHGNIRGILSVYLSYFTYFLQTCSHDAGTHMQVLLVEWLRVNEEREASTWLREFWVADGKGRWLLADIFIGMIPNNQGLDAKWR